MARVRYSFGSRHTGRIDNIRKQRAKYPDVARDVMRVSDIILEVLDARFIEETRNKQVEQELKKQGKKLIYVLNKIDLVARKTFEKSLPKDLKPYVMVSAAKGTGSRELRNRISMESKRVELEEGRKRVQVGIIGYPNTGKSSLINMIAKRGAAKTSKQAGHTKGMQKIRMSEHILVLDTPGVISQEHYSTHDQRRFSHDARVGARTYSDVKDPEEVVYHLMTPPVLENPEEPTVEEKQLIANARKASEAIQGFYGIDAGGDSEKLIEELGREKHFLKKGGKVNVDRAARLILKDWQEGRIKIA